MVEPAHGAGRAPPKRLFGRLIAFAPARAAIVAVCRYMSRRDEVALVGSTILARQVAEFGAVLRPVPPGLQRSWDTFYRKLILLAFHPGGADRAAHDSPSVLEAAIARVEFCRRFR
jgi:hypothetical protein